MEPNLWDQLEWLMANSDGVSGLKLDGTVLPWRDVADLYASELRPILNQTIPEPPLHPGRNQP